MITGRGLYKLLLVLGIMGVADTTMLLFFRVGINFGVLFPGGLGLVFVIAGLLNHFWAVDVFGFSNRMLFRTYTIFLTLWLISFIFIEGLIISAQFAPAASRDYMIVLGAALHGERMSRTLTSRMNTTLLYLQEHPSTKVVVSGGQGRGESITEAEAMKRFLVGRGISESRIRKEERSTSTLENLMFSKTIITEETKALSKVMIVTNDFHLYRAKMLAKRVGLDATGLSAPTPLSIMVNSYGREYLALIKSYLFDQ